MNDLSKRVNSEISIGSFKYEFFNNLSIREFLIYDLQGDTLVYIESLNAHFNFFQFFQGKIIFYDAKIDGLYSNIVINEEGEANYHFLIEAFSNQEKKDNPLEFEYFIKQFTLNNTELNFTNNIKQPSAIHPASENRINFTKLHFEDIFSEISIDIFTKDTFNIKIKDFHAKESSGLELTGFKTGVSGSPSNLNIPRIDINLPASHLQVDNITLNYDSFLDLFKFSDKVSFSASLKNSNLTLRDISPFVPQFRNMDANIQLAADLDGNISNLNLNNISIKYGNDFRFRANLNLNGLPNIHQAFVYADIKELTLNGKEVENFVSDWIQEPFNLPEGINNLGMIDYQGNITGFFSRLVLYGNLKTDVGNISTDILFELDNNYKDLKYNGTVKSGKLNLGHFLNNKNFGNMSFYFNTAGGRKLNSPLVGIIDASVTSISLNGYTYENIQFNGEYNGNGFNGILKIGDENIDASFNGLIDMAGDLPLMNFDLKVNKVNLYALNLIKKYPDLLVSLNANTNIIGNSLDNLNGFIRFDSINILNKEDSLTIDKILFTSHTEKDYTNFSMESEYLNGSFSGSFQYSTLAETATQLLYEYLPSIDNHKKRKPINNHINIDLSLENTERISDILELPYTIGGKSTIKGYVNEKEEIIDIVLNVPKIYLNEQDLNNTMLHVWGVKEKLEVILESNIPTQNDFWNFSLYTTAQNDSLIADIEWRNRQQVVNRGKFKTITEFSRKKNDLFAHTSILPAEVIISNLLFKIEESSIDILPNKSLIFNNFQFGNQTQHISIDGTASKNEHDSINFDLKDIDLEYISNLANMTGFQLGGKTTGKAIVYSLFDKPAFNASLSIDNLQFNQKRMGDASVFATWDEENSQVLAIAEIKEGKQKVALGECTYLPKDKRIDVNIDLEWVSIHFLTRYFETVLPDAKAYATGFLHIGGPLDAIRFDGRLRTHEGEITVGVLGTKYALNDSIILTPNAIEFRNITAYDMENNKVNINGALTHNGKFKDFRYNLSIEARNAMIMNLKAGTTDFLFGKAYGDANVRITGDNDIVNIRVDAITKPGTKAYFKTLSTSNATEAGFIQFVQHEEPEEDGYIIKKIVKKQELSSKLVLNLQLEVTPDADIEYIIDPVGGDMIAGRGRGNVRVEYDNSQSDVKMYGSFEIENGKYLFTLQDVFRKEFRIERGSNIQWTGSPDNAQVSIRAVYSVNAYLKDLISEDLLTGAAVKSGGRTSIPVNCILVLTDNLLSPTVQFEIELPSSDEAVKQLVRSVINTDEMMMNQILYLLVFNKFYTPDYIREDGSNVFNNEFMALASSTVSAQLNRLLSQFSQNNVFSIGFDFRKADDNDMEYQVDLQYQPNERWIINGNLGYRENNALIKDLNQFITDIDIEYILTRSGKLRVKAYNHTIDGAQAQLRNARDTQGIGLMYKEDFDSFTDIFRYYWRLVANIGKKEKNEETEENQQSANNN